MCSLLGRQVREVKKAFQESETKEGRKAQRSLLFPQNYLSFTLASQTTVLMTKHEGIALQISVRTRFLRVSTELTVKRGIYNTCICLCFPRHVLKIKVKHILCGPLNNFSMKPYDHYENCFYYLNIKCISLCSYH